MPRFTYTARDRSGQNANGAIDAPSRRDALRLLSARGFHVTGMSEASSAPTASQAKTKAAAPKEADPAKTPLTRKERLPFLEALHDLTSSGLSAGEAVRLLSVRIKEPKLRLLSRGLWERLSEGAPLSRAMADFDAVFDPATINLINAGEATGSLNDTLSRLITHLTEQRELRRQLVAALAYPVFMVFVASLVILFFSSSCCRGCRRCSVRSAANCRSPRSSSSASPTSRCTTASSSSPPRCSVSARSGAGEKPRPDARRPIAGCSSFRSSARSSSRKRCSRSARRSACCSPTASPPPRRCA
ncbi:MAG: type II secretion system F family protein [Opitutus sp.]|nr:type II secretion system F family protein [Opitutus sp.]